MQNKSPTTKRNQWLLAFLLFIFIAPIIAAQLFFHFGYHSSNTTNHGVIIKPPLQLNVLPLGAQSKLLKGHWLLLYVNPKACDKTCKDTLYKIRQIRTALGKERERAVRVLVQLEQHPLDQSTQQLLETNYQGTVVITVTQQQLEGFLAQSGSKTDAINKGLLYLVDPMNNVIMYYNLSSPPRAVYEDLTRLLKYSQIG